MAEIDRMIQRGEYYPIPSDAPELPVDDDFWAKAKRVSEETASIELTLRSSTIEHFRSQGPDALARMAKVLDDHAAKKAS